MKERRSQTNNACCTKLDSLKWNLARHNIFLLPPVLEKRDPMKSGHETPAKHPFLVPADALHTAGHACQLTLPTHPCPSSAQPIYTGSSHRSSDSSPLTISALICAQTLGTHSNHPKGLFHKRV